MELVLNNKNVLEYLDRNKICKQEELQFSKIEVKSAQKNNLLVSFSDGRKLLFKQETRNHEGKNNGYFLNEWKIQELVKRFTALSKIKILLPEIIHFNASHSILIVNYLNDYRDLTDLYIKENLFPSAIASLVGSIIGQIHRQTFKCQEYQEFFSQASKSVPVQNAFNTFHELKRIDPEVFSLFPAEGLKFFVLYQRYDTLGQAIAELATAFCPCCLTHNDLKLKNILLHVDWEQALLKNELATNGIIRLIDWKRAGWGDPAFDLGMLIAGYLQIWLSSLVINTAIDIEDSLRLAAIPLEQIQPSLTGLTNAYVDNFPDILDHRPDFLCRVVQYSGLGLIHQIQAMIQYQKTFGNLGICMLQVAKTLLCSPEQIGRASCRERV